MRTIKYCLALLFVTFVAISCNVDNADSPANTVTQADTTTTNPQPVAFDNVIMDPAALDTNALDTAVPAR